MLTVAQNVFVHRTIIYIYVERDICAFHANIFISFKPAIIAPMRIPRMDVSGFDHRNESDKLKFHLKCMDAMLLHFMDVYKKVH